ncbi:rod shape-determining protein MreD [Novosphingobium flavum]|uniref:Rod shape-determining protein MreD n=1 Tax=Novosphingobium flavum TaxID=1778672 RepID=A0A7X1FPZ8_9SPHN|nr:rod shape-determining protein MreD [Novosphingobium flavum]MBC2664748.1 rod shape-determining protein MreD [Novosphingobium flavum]
MNAFGPAESNRVINRAPSPLVARALPWLVIMAGSVAQGMPLIASAPVMPPFGFLLLLAWRQLRPGVLPVWAGLPLGLFDDCYSGQPMGSGMLLWSAAMIGMDAIEIRFPWRSYVMEWLVAAAFILGYLLLAGGIAHVGGSIPVLNALVPQLIFSVLTFPLVERFVAACDRARLWRFRAFT